MLLTTRQVVATATRAVDEMLVRCVKNRRDELSAAEISLDGVEECFGSYEEVALTNGAHYVVYALSLGAPDWYFVADENYTYYPFAYPAVFFKVVDQRESRYWVAAAGEGAQERTFREWSEDPYFYDSLTDGEPAAVEAFRRVKSLMDREFIRPEIVQHAVHLEGNWLMCPTCDEAWECTPDQALTLCPKCGGEFRCPIWREEK
jgi:hypothetical protein